MKMKFITLFITGLVALSTPAYSQQSTVAHSSIQVGLTAKDTKTTAAKPVAKASLFKRKPKATAPTAALGMQDIAMEQQLATFVFVVNRGEIFSVNAPGELTELSLSGFTTDPLPNGCEGTLNETASRNTVTLSGAVTINDYSPEPATHVIASLKLRPLTAARGLTLTLTIDGTPQRVLLPFDSGDCRWRAGHTYRYVLTLNGGMLQVTGMTVSK